LKPRQTLTPAMLRTRYHESSAGRSGGEPRHPQPLAANEAGAIDATADWLAHIDAGRIEVR